MIDVGLTPFMKQMMILGFGAMTKNVLANKKAMQILNQENEAIQTLEKERELWDDISFDMTTRMIDKRFTSSREYIQSGGLQSGSLQFKKSVTEEDRKFQFIAEQNMLKSRTKYDNAISKQNKRLADLKIKASFKLADLKKVIV